MPRLEEKIRKWIADQSDMAQILYMILQDIHYYSESELAVFKTQLEWMRRAAPSERAKKKADYLCRTAGMRPPFRCTIPSSRARGIRE